MKNDIVHNKNGFSNEILYDEPKEEYFFSKIIFFIILIICIGIAIICSYVFITNINNFYFWIFLLFMIFSLMIGYQLFKNFIEERPFRITHSEIYLREKKFKPIKIKEITKLEWRNNKTELYLLVQNQYVRFGKNGSESIDQIIIEIEKVAEILSKLTKLSIEEK